MMKLGLAYSWKFNYLYRDLPLYGSLSFVNSNFAGDSEDYKLVMGHWSFLNRAVVSWSRKKQRIVFISITKVKYITLDHASRVLVWI